MKRRIIEDFFPVTEVSKAASREKNIRHGHISTLHVWWARRPLGSSRAVIAASLISKIPKASSRNCHLHELISKLSQWESIKDKELLTQIRDLIRASNDGKTPRVLDPFSGGGSIPLEALRLGCETHALDYNPVAVIIQKCILEFPQALGAKLLPELERWSTWCLEEVEKDLLMYYQVRSDENIIGFLWCWEIPCPNPSCGIRIPLLKQFWLSRRKKKRVFLYPLLTENDSTFMSSHRIDFKIVMESNDQFIMTDDTSEVYCEYGSQFPPFKFLSAFDPSRGTVNRANVRCPRCLNVVPSRLTRKVFNDGEITKRILVTIFKKKGRKGKFYRIATSSDQAIFEKAKEFFRLYVENEKLPENLTIIPHESLPPPGTLGFGAPSYGRRRWKDLFNERQLLFLTTFLRKILQVKHRLLTELKMEKHLVKAVTCYLALWMDMAAAFSNTLVRWENTTEAAKQVFARHALPMIWDHVEVNPFSGSTGSLKTILQYQLKVIRHCLQIEAKPAIVQRHSATNLPYPASFFDAIITDPPYYDNVPYAPLSDFFYVWLKRTIADLFPELFSTPLTPKSGEIVAYTRGQDPQAARRHFEIGLTQAFREMHRVLKDDGMLVVVFAHKSNVAWIATIKALMEAGFVITASWPVVTEMRGRLRSLNSATLSSSIHLVARKGSRGRQILYAEILQQVRHKLKEHLQLLMATNFTRSDLFITVIGASLEIWSSWEQVIDPAGKIISLEKFLEEVQRLSMSIMIESLLESLQLAKLSKKARFYLLWRWLYGEESISFDDAFKLALGANFDLDHELKQSDLLEKRGSRIQLATPLEREPFLLEKSSDFLDQFHQYIRTLHLLDEAHDSLERSTIFANSQLIREFQSFAQLLQRLLPRDSVEARLYASLSVK